MIQSMTGFGKSVLQLPSKKITVEIKSLNSKNLDLNARLPSQYREKELQLRNKISRDLTRGKVDFSVYVEVTGEETSSAVNSAAVKKYMAQLREIHPASDVDLLQMAVRMPDAFKTEREEIDADEFKAIEEAVDEALREINDFRSAEGKALEDELEQRAGNIQELLKQVIAMDPERIAGVRERLQKGVAELKRKC